MKYIVAFVLALTGLQPSHADELTPSAWCYRNALVNWTPDIALEPIFEGIPVGATAANQGILDDVAEFLLLHLDDKQLTKENSSDVLGFLARTPGGRYRLVMERVNASKRLVKLADVARKYLREYKNSTAEQYVPGSGDFAALRERYVQQALLPQPTEERARAFDSLRSGDSLEKLFALLGPPQRVETRYYRVNDAVNLRRLVLFYRGAGRATFLLDDETGWGFQASVADPLAFEMLMPYRARAGELGLLDDEHIRMAQLTSGGASAARAAIESAYRLPNVSVDFLDATAELLASQWPSAKDEGVEDNCGWMLRLLRTKGGVRYAPLFLEIQKKSHSLKLKKWSKLTLLEYPDFLRGSYVVGSVPLEEWARRYPSPYPGVNYTNGRL